MALRGIRIHKIRLRKLKVIRHKDPNRPKKPPSSFLLYASHERKERKEYDLKTAGETWNSEPLLRKQYLSKADEMEVQHRIEMKSFMERLGNAYDAGEFSDDDLNTLSTVKSSFTENTSVSSYYPKPLPASSLPSVFPVLSERQYPPSSCQGYKKIGIQHGLFHYNPPRSGKCFLHTRGLRVAEKLLSFLTNEYHKRGYIEVTSPSKLWEKSGNAVIDYESIFLFDGNDKDPALVNMLSMLGHILKYGSQVGSSRDLPLRIADIGVLRCTDEHTHVQRFHHGESRVFCTEAQLVDEVRNILDLVCYVGRTLGLLLRVKLCLSKRSGCEGWVVCNTEVELVRELALIGLSCKLEGGRSSSGPRLEIFVGDDQSRGKRMFQCGFIQVDFISAERSDISYSAEFAPDRKRPVVLHSLMFPSFDQMYAIVLDRCRGKLPFWLSPYQAILLPVSKKFKGYSIKVMEKIAEAGYSIEMDTSDRTLNKKVCMAQMAHYNYLLVVGAKEEETGKVSVRLRDEFGYCLMSIDELIHRFNKNTEEFE